MNWFTFVSNKNYLSDPDENPAPSEVHSVFLEPLNGTEVEKNNESNNDTSIVKNNDENVSLNLSSNSKKVDKSSMNYDQIIDRRNSNDKESSESRIPPPIIDDEELKEKNLEAHSFGFKVTVFRSPGNKGNKLWQVLCYFLPFVFFND